MSAAWTLTAPFEGVDAVVYRCERCNWCGPWSATTATTHPQNWGC